jgi:hypothetical protein
MHVGLFGKNKKNEVTREGTQSDIRTPELPEEQAEWFESNKRSLASSSAITNTWQALPNSWINVETAAVFISNRIPPVCELCEEVDTCSSCGKNESNFLSMLTANQDSDWEVWELQSIKKKEDRQGSNIADGILVLFDDQAHSTLISKGGLKFTAQDMAPIKIGTLVVNPVLSDEGMIHIADKVATQDSNFFISGTRVKAGSYQVVAWMGFNKTTDKMYQEALAIGFDAGEIPSGLFGALTPVALGIYGEAFADDLIEDLKLTNEAPEAIKALIKTCENVISRLENHQEHYAQVNGEFWDYESLTHHHIARSWDIQLLSEGEQSDEFFAWLMEEEMEVGERLSALDSLRIRGKQSLTLSYLDKIEAKFGDELSNRDKRTIELMRSLPSGQHIFPA